jgi:hypothetical protein
VQHDYAVFGFGETRTDAITMAAQWLKDETGKQGCTVDYAESLLVTSSKPRTNAAIYNHPNFMELSL